MSLADEIAHYFAAERSGAWVFILIGVAAIVLPLVWIVRDGGSLAKGFAVPVVVVGVIQVLVAGYVLSHTRIMVPVYMEASKTDQATLKLIEIPRVAKVMANFKVFKAIEVAFIAVGLAGCLFVTQPYWLGIAMGMLIQGALMLPADIVAERRGAVYQEALQSIR